MVPEVWEERKNLGGAIWEGNLPLTRGTKNLLYLLRTEGWGVQERDWEMATFSRGAVGRRIQGKRALARQVNEKSMSRELVPSVGKNRGLGWKKR